jgi:hypothetical protein
VDSVDGAESEFFRDDKLDWIIWLSQFDAANRGSGPAGQDGLLRDEECGAPASQLMRYGYVSWRIDILKQPPDGRSPELAGGD